MSQLWKLWQISVGSADLCGSEDTGSMGYDTRPIWSVISSSRRRLPSIVDADLGEKLYMSFCGLRTFNSGIFAAQRRIGVRVNKPI